jgi:hypothetical protein
MGRTGRKRAGKIIVLVTEVRLKMLILKLNLHFIFYGLKKKLFLGPGQRRAHVQSVGVFEELDQQSHRGEE